MDRAGIERAVKLLAKAASTDSEAEAIALTENSYRLLARVITAYDLERGESTFGAGRRERRLLPDRRAPRATPVAASERAAHGGAIYSELASLGRDSSASTVNLNL